MKKGLVCLAAALAICSSAGTVKAESILDKVQAVVEQRVLAAAEEMKEALAGGLQGTRVSLGNMYTTGNLTLRAKATKESDKLAVVPINTEVPVYENTQEYFQVEYKGQMGYVLGEYLTEDKEVAEQAEQEALEEERKREEKKKASSSSYSGGGSYDDDDDDDYYYEEEEEDDGGSQKINDEECVTGGLLN